MFTTQWRNTGGLKQKHKKQPFGDASASHLSLVLCMSDFKQRLESAKPQPSRRPLTRAHHIAPRIKTARRFTAKNP